MTGFTAHTGESEGGGTFVFVLAGIALIAAGLRMRGEASKAPAGWGLVLGGVLVAVIGLATTLG